MATDSKGPVEEYFRGLKDKNGLEEALSRLWVEASNTLTAVQQRAEEMALRQKAERSEVRRHIVKRHQSVHGPDATIATSPLVLIVTTGIDSLELGWSRTWRKKGTKETNLTRVKMDTSSGHRRNTLLKEAHSDEGEVLWAHELEARDIRHRWQDAMTIRRAVRSAMQKYRSEGSKRATKE